MEQDRAVVSPAELIRETQLRERAMEYVRGCAERSGGVISRAQLEAFEFEGAPLKLIDRNSGIRNPAGLVATISILSKQSGPYDDHETTDGVLRYAYQVEYGNRTAVNAKLRAAGELALPVLLLRWIADGVYVPVCPVYVVDDHPDRRFFDIALDESLRLMATGTDAMDANQRRYAERLAKLGLHQPVFRARVLRAYERACAICRLRHAELLDAAHILENGHPRGLPVVPNGLSLCKIHHAAFDLTSVNLVRSSDDQGEGVSEVVG